MNFFILLNLFIHFLLLMLIYVIVGLDIMGIKDIIILVLIIAIIGAVLFGSVGNFFSTMAGVITGVSDTVNSNEGYVYKGGYIDNLQSSDVSSGGSVVDGSSSDVSSGGSVVDGSSSDASSEGNLLSSNGESSSSGNYASSSGSGSESSSSSSNSDVKYDDYQRDYETGMVDEEGNPIYLSIVSTSGGEMEPGIYQVYWSTLGPINQTRIG